VRPRTRAAKALRDQRRLIDVLDASERKRLLKSLLDAHPELLAETAATADAELSAVNVEDVAEDVALVVGELQIEDVWERSGAQLASSAGTEPTASGKPQGSWSRLGRRAQGEQGPGGSRDGAAMQAFVYENLPEWQTFLIRMLGRKPKQRRRQ